MAKVIIGADHRGFRLKEKIKEKLMENEISVEDIGAVKYDPSDDFADFGFLVAEKVMAEKCLGIVICASGIGISIAANKVKGVRAGLCTSIKQVRLAKNDDNINVLCLSSELVTNEKNLKIVNKFIKTVFSPTERYLRRINKIKKYES